MNDSILRLKRTSLTEKATIGELYGPGGEFLCFTLEDPVRKTKIPGQTSIPAGVFEVIVGWSNRFQAAMPRLCGVPFYEGILIHKGNTVANTEGCVLVGQKKDEANGSIWESQIAFEKVFPLIRKLTEKGKVYLQVDGGFPPAEWDRGT